MWNKALILIVFCFVFVTANMAAVAQPAFFDMSKIEKIPTYDEELSNEDYEQYSDLYEETPKGDKFLAYRIRLPRGWRKVEVGAHQSYKADEGEQAGLSRRMLGEVARYYGPGRIETLTRFDIQALSLDHEVTAKNWFMHEILARGYTLEGLKEHSDRRVEVLYVVVEGDVAYVVRAIAEINGPRMIVASYAVPEQFWMKERALQQRSIESFEFVSPEISRIEMVRTHNFLDLLSFDYPASWRLIAPAVYSVEGMEAKLVSSMDDVTLVGEIQISVISAEFEEAVMQEIEYLKEDIRLRGLEFGELVQTIDDFEFEDYIHYGHVEVYQLSNEEQTILPHEYWIAIIEEDRYFYVIGMLTPGREGEFYTWARNKEAYKTVVESFKL